MALHTKNQIFVMLD